MFNYLKLSLLSASLVGTTAITQASQAQPTKDEIVVTAKGNQSLANVLPTSAVFESDEIEASQATDLAELLNQLTGVNVNDSGGRGSVTSVFVRGLSASQTIVLIDGVRVGSATLGAAALNNYPIEAIERIEVVKGPLSGIYGADAVSGVIQLFTKKGNTGESTVSVTIGSNSLKEFNAGIQGSNDVASFHVGIHTEETDGIDRTSIISDGNADIDGYEETAISLGGQLKLGEKTSAQLSLLSTDNNTHFDNLFGADPGLMTDTKTFNSALNITTQFNDRLRWSSTFGINKDQEITNGEFPSDITTNRDNFGTELLFNINDNTSITAGIDHFKEDIETNADFPVTERDNTGAFLLLQSSLDKFSFVGSLRYDDNSAYGTNTNSSVALNYNFTDNIRIVASYGTAFAAPSFNFLYFPFFGNPDILPEESDSYELSLLGRNDALNWRVSAYKTDVTNLFSFDPQTFLAANIGAAEIEGLEFELATVVADWNLNTHLDLLSAQDKDTGVELDDRAERTLSASAQRSFGEFDVNIKLKNESNRYDNRGTKLGGYTLMDISAEYHINDKFSILANIDNLFDKDYTLNLIGQSDRYHTQGRQSKLTLRYSF